MDFFGFYGKKYVCLYVCIFNLSTMEKFEMTDDSLHKITTAIVHDTRQKSKAGNSLVKLRVTFRKLQKYYSTGVSFSAQDYHKCMLDPKPKGVFKDYKIQFMEIENKARDIIAGMKTFSFDTFEKKFFSTSSETPTINSYYEKTIEKLRKEGRIETANNYSGSFASMLSFSSKKKLLFEDITSDFLDKYERFMIQGGRKFSTIGFYLRPLRAIFNEAISDQVISNENYPFGKRKYQIPKGVNIKKALTLNDVERIYNFDVPEKSSFAFSKDLWLFSYLCNGINIKDITRLKYKNIANNSITFIRAKTELTTRKNQKSISVVITPEVEEIIQKWGNSDKNPEQYVFPILTDDLTPTQEQAKIKQATKTINKYIKRIANAVGIEKHVTTYTARHTFSTVLKRSGAPIEFISESLGHSNIGVTESYLDNFEQDIKKEYAAKLTAFKKNITN